MNNLPLIIAALVLLPAIGVVVWAWWSMARTEDDLRTAAGLQGSDFEIGTWPTSARVR